ncbi:MAG: acyltransferase [Bacteroidales bacterium]|nr:acyltransferase [Bacteroidales bacterium]
MKKIVVLIIKLFSYVFSYKFYQKFIGYRNSLYTLWIRNFIGYVGEHSYICTTCSLQGGGQKNITIGEYTIIQSHSILGCWVKYGEQKFPNASITIGNQCSIGEYNHITACNRITIGDGVLTGRFVYIGDNSHGELSVEDANIPPAKRLLKSKGEVIIGNNVWLGDKVAVLAGVHIGNNVIVAANAVVTKDIPDNCMVAGVPGKIIKRLD